MSKKLNVKELVSAVMCCGDCSGFNRDTLFPNAEKPCSKQGRLEAESICPQFKSNAFSLAESMSKGTAVQSLLDMTAALSDKDIKAVAGLMLKELKTRAFGVTLGTRVYVRFRGRPDANFASNFAAARILDVTQEHVRLISDDGSISLTFENTGFAGPEMYSEKAFATIKKDIIRKGKAYDPSIEREKAKRDASIREGDTSKMSDAEATRFKIPNDLDGFEIPKLEKVAKKTKRNSTKSQTMTLLDIADVIDKGTYLGTKSDAAGVVTLGSNSYRRIGIKGRKLRGESKGTSTVALDDLED